MKIRESLYEARKWLGGRKGKYPQAQPLFLGTIYKMSPHKMSPHESPLGSDFTKFSYPDPDQGLEFGPLLFQVQSNMYILFFPKTVEDTTVYCTINIIRIFVDFPSDLIWSDSDRGILGTISDLFYPTKIVMLRQNVVTKNPSTSTVA